MKPAVVATILLMGASAWAQDAPAAASQDQSGGQAGRPADSEYGGPTLPDRGGTPSVLRGGDLAHITPFLGVTALYNGDLLARGVDAQGNPTYSGGYGFAGMFGVSGTHVWERSTLDLDYHGYYRNYSGYSLESGFDNSLSLSFEHKLSPHLSLSVNENAARVRSGYSLPLGSLYGGGVTGFNPLFNALTASNLTYIPTLASMTTVRLLYQATARLSFSAGGTGIVSRQNLTETVGANGWIANGDIAYRLSRYQTISLGYSFTHFTYVNQYGEADMNGLGVSYSARLGRYWEVSASGGVSRSESLRAQAIPLDPILAQLLGFSVVFEKMYDLLYLPYGQVSVTRAFHHSSWRANYSRSIVAGNGLFLASTYQNAGSTYTYSGLRRVSLDAGVGYYQYSAMMQSLGQYRSFGLSGGVSVPMGKGFSSIGRVDGRRYSISGSSLNRNGYVVSLGFSWNPGSYPVSLW